MEQIQLNPETEALLEEVMWQMKGDMHNLVGEYNPAFTDKTERHMRKLLLTIQQSHHQELQKARQDWLREEIVRLEGMKVLGLYSQIKNNILQTIIDSYHSELDQDNK